MKIKKFEYEKVMRPDDPPFERLIEYVLKGEEKKYQAAMVTMHDVFKMHMCDYLNNIYETLQSKEGFLEVEQKSKFFNEDLENKAISIEDKRKEKLLSYNFAASDTIKRWMRQTGFEDLSNIPEEDLTRSQARRGVALKYIFKTIGRIASELSSFDADMTYCKVLSHIRRAGDAAGHYLVAKDFFEDFKKVNLKNLTFDNLPQNECGIIKLPVRIPYIEGEVKDAYGDKVYFDEVLFTSGDNEGYSRNPDNNNEIEKIRRVSFAWLFGDEFPLGLGFLRFTESVQGMTLEESWQRRVESTNDSTKLIMDGSSGMNDDTCKRVLANLLAYIKSGNPDLRDYQNIIRRNSVTGEPHAPFTHLTDKSLKLVGYSWKKLPNYSASHWSSAPHFGWRRCGPGRTQVRFSFVEGCVKTRRLVTEDIKELDYDFDSEGSVDSSIPMDSISRSDIDLLSRVPPDQEAPHLT